MYHVFKISLIFTCLKIINSVIAWIIAQVITMFKCGPGKAVGLLGLITGEPNIYGVQATTKTIVAVLSRETFYSVVRQYPKALFSVTHIISSHLSPLFHQLDFAIEWLSVKSGKALYK